MRICFLLCYCINYIRTCFILIEICVSVLDVLVTFSGVPEYGREGRNM